MAGDGLYLVASQILSQVCSGKGALRTLCYSSNIQNKKALYGLLLETARHFKLLSRVLTQSSWLELVNKNRKSLPAGIRRIDLHLGLVLLQDFLFSTLRCSAELKSLVEKSKARLRAELVRAQLQFKRENLPEGFSSDLEESKVPRFVRVNRCLVSESETENLLNQLAAHTKLSFSNSNTKLLEITESSSSFYWDEHVKDLLVFPASTDLIKCPAYTSNLIILQDKASCFPPIVLNPPVGCDVIDACAAPGNKTSQLAALIGKEGKVFAFERDLRRFQTLAKLTAQATNNSSVILPAHADFLTIDPSDPKYAKVEYILCDPSCSGSGMPMSLERSLSEQDGSTAASVDDSKDRLVQLSKFQTVILKHAAKFPSVRRLVYSTCSIHTQENELVIQDVLKSCPHLRLVKKILPTWPRRGADGFDFSDDVIRADSKLDQMNGFFVALFERI